MTEYLTNTDSGRSMTVSARQTQDSWQGPQGTIVTMVNGSESQIAYNAKTAGTNYTVAIDASGAVTVN